jgi:hypothetical protein
LANGRNALWDETMKLEKKVTVYICETDEHVELKVKWAANTELIERLGILEWVKHCELINAEREVLAEQYNEAER